MEGPGTTFFGREGELSELGRLLECTVLVTLVGPGGIGKTRLAQCIFGAQRSSRKSGAALWCELHHATGTDDLCHALACALQHTGQWEADGVATLGRELARLGRGLVVLDGCERSVQAVSAALSQWTRMAPRLCWLVTSREPLKLAAEHVYEVPSLSCPDPATPPTREVVLASDAGRMFVERAVRANASFRVDEHSAAAVAALVQALDGHPLLIELAAARMSILSPRALLARVEASRLDALGTASRDAPGRHRDVRSVVAWSWDTLDAWAKAALAQCAVFTRSFSVETFEAVVDVAGFAEAPPSIEVLQALRDKSLLRVCPCPHEPGTLRFAMPESIREFALEQLVADAQEDAVRARHARHFLGHAAQWGRTLLDGGSTAQGLVARRWFERELANLLAVHAWALSRLGARAEARREVLEAMLALEPALTWRGNVALEHRLLSATLAAAAAPTADERPLYAHALIARARLLRRAGDVASAAADLQDALALSRDTTDPVLVARALTALAVESSQLGKLDAAREAFEESLALLVGQERHPLHMHTLIAYASMHLLSGAMDRAEPLFAAALRVARETGSAEHILFATSNLGLMRMEQAQFDEARVLFEEATELARALGNPRWLGTTVGYAAQLDHELGDVPRARRLYDEAISLLREAGDRNHAALFEAALASLEADARNFGRARRLLDHAEAEIETAGLKPSLVAVRLHRARVELAHAAARDPRAGVDRGARALPDRQTLVGDDARFAWRLLARAIEEARGSDVSAVLRVGPDARWFVTDGVPVDLGRRRRLRAVLCALVRRHLDSPGKVTPVHELVAAVWPDERLRPDVARHRLQVLVSTIRSLGLRSLLVADADGYLLARTLVVHVDDQEHVPPAGSAPATIAS